VVFHLIPVITGKEFVFSKFIFCCSTDGKGILKMSLKIQILLILAVSIRRKYSFLGPSTVKQFSETKYMKYINIPVKCI